MRSRPRPGAAHTICAAACSANSGPDSGGAATCIRAGAPSFAPPSLRRLAGSERERLVGVIGNELVGGHGDCALVYERQGEHLLRKGVVRTKAQRLVVALDCLPHVALEVSLELMREAQRGVSAGGPRRQAERALVPRDSLVEVVLLAVRVRQVHHRGLPPLCRGLRHQRHCLLEIRHRSRVIAVAIRKHAKFVVHQGVRRANLASLTEELLRQAEVVGALVLHADAQHREVAAGEQPRGGTVGGHGLVALVLRRERVAEAHPGGNECPLQRGGFAEVASRGVELPHAVVVARHGEPAHRFVRVFLHELVRAEVQLVLAAQLHGHGQVHGQGGELERVLIQQVCHHVVAALEVPAVIQPLSLSQGHLTVVFERQELWGERRLAPPAPTPPSTPPSPSTATRERIHVVVAVAIAVAVVVAAAAAVPILIRLRLAPRNAAAASDLFENLKAGAPRHRTST
mmetsp:Transcript_14814/g.36301  ORF Transcript_14814/g.36301 Transcript_14814/m.36301 type:complete len:458 (-) Transcript_14814:30-1403(-)